MKKIKDKINEHIYTGFKKTLWHSKKLRTKNWVSTNQG